MKIYAFDVREDEQQYFEELKKKYSIDLVIEEEPVSLNLLAALEPNSGITILGFTNIGEAECAVLEKQGIHYLTTRSIGYNNIDLDACRKHAGPSAVFVDHGPSGSQTLLHSRNAPS